MLFAEKLAREAGKKKIKLVTNIKNTPAITFYKSIGYADDLTIDRIKNDLGYEPANCQWLTKSENSKKVRSEERVARYV